MGRDWMGILAQGHCKLEGEREAEDQVLSPGCNLPLPASPVVSPDDWVNDKVWVWMPEVPACCCTPDHIRASVSLSVQGPAPSLHVQILHRLLRTFLPGRTMGCVICYDNFADVCCFPSAPPSTLPFMINDITLNLHLAMQISLAVTDAAVHMETSYLYPLALNKRLGRWTEWTAESSMLELSRDWASPTLIKEVLVMLWQRQEPAQPVSGGQLGAEHGELVYDGGSVTHLMGTGQSLSHAPSTEGPWPKASAPH